MLSEPVICFDLDGTLIDADGHIHPRDIEILRARRDLCLIPTTGRVLHSTRATLCRNGLFCGERLPLPLVMQNGGALYLPGEQVCAYQPFLPETQASLVDLVAHFPRVFFLLVSCDLNYMLAPTPYGYGIMRQYDLHADLYPSGDGIALSKILALADDPAALHEVAEAGHAFLAEQAFSMPTILEFTPPGVTKASGLRRLLAIMCQAGYLKGDASGKKGSLDCSELPVYAAGDGGNDLALLEMAQRTFAPLTSPIEVRQRVDRVVDTRQEGILAPMLAEAGLIN
jgi:HAD superfamily hydrolase (TIGR01484 family)